MRTTFTVRITTPDDVPVIVRHRVGMFRDMGILPSALSDELTAESARYLEAAIPSGEYLGWLASPTDRPQEIVAGAGVQRRRVLPHPVSTANGIVLALRQQAIVLNVYTDRAWRRQGLARLLMQQVLDWARSADIDSLVLHASGEGRPLYEELGFVATNEMRYGRPLR
ncbi:MAG: GNAT family N-acetyltransferase [Acidobacteria bacterium]|nr:GNAT family N-acetyltransferase [Acidobacteriota bacterium]